VVECFLAKEDVAGSTPVSRSSYFPPAIHSSLHEPGVRESAGPPEARYPSGKGEVCKTFMRRFDPDPRLQYILLKTK
jgi:hypothetical protein